MGFKSFFSNLFKRKPISLPEKRKNALIHPMSSSVSTIKLGEKLRVDEGWCALVVAKDRPLDVFPSGEHELCVAMLPKTSALLKLTKGKIKKSKDKVDVIVPDRFKCDLYYINLEPFKNLSWRSGSFGARSKRYGLYRVKMMGTVDIQVTKPADFMKLFLYEWSHIPAGKGEKYLSELIGEECNLRLLKSDYSNPNDFLDTDKISKYLLEELNKNFARYGINIDAVKVVDVSVSGKVANQIKQEQESEAKGDTGLVEEVQRTIDESESPSESEKIDTEPQLELPDEYSKYNADIDELTQQHRENMKEQEQKSLDVDTMEEGAQEKQQNKPKKTKSKSKKDKKLDIDNKDKATEIDIEALLDEKDKDRSIDIELPEPERVNVTVGGSKVDISVEKSSPEVDLQERSQKCPVCGSKLLDGVCLNCEAEKQKKDKK